MAQAVSNDEELITGINVTPLVDVVLVLLIVLMVTASYMVSKSIPVDLPKGATGENVNRTLAFTITRQGAVLLDGSALDGATSTCLPIRLSSIRPTPRIVDSSSTMECSISVSSSVQPK